MDLFMFFKICYDVFYLYFVVGVFDFIWICDVNICGFCFVWKFLDFLFIINFFGVDCEYGSLF